jgi:ribosome-binding factor A
VVLSPDLSVARVRVSVMPEERASLTLSGLRAGAGFLRRRVMDETRISRVPRLEFELDDRIKRQAALDEAIRSPGVADEAGAAAKAAEKAAGEKISENPRDEG